MGSETTTRTGLRGRAHECSVLESAVSAAVDHRPTVVVLEGGWGSGKSALLDHARTVALDRRAIAVSVRAGFDAPSDGSPVVDRLLARLRATTATPARPPERTLSAAVAAVAAVASREPLVLCIDDAHALDGPSAQSLIGVLASLDGLAVALVLGGRPQARVAWNAVRSAVARVPSSRFLALAPLGADDAEAMVHDQLRGLVDAVQLDPVQLDAVRRASGGIPRLLRAGADMLQDGASPDSTHPAVIPVSVRREMGALLHELDQPARSLAETAAAAAVVRDPDGPVYPRVISGVAGLDAEPAAIAIDHLVDAGVLASRDLRFAAPLGARSIVATMSGSRLEQVHSALANALWSAGASNDRVVEHLLRTPPGRSSWAIEMLRAVAAESLVRGDRPAAAAMLRRALDEHPIEPVRASLLAELARVEAAEGSPAALDRIDQAVAAQPNVEGRCSLLYAAGRALLASGRTRDAVAVFERGLHQRIDTGWPLLFRSSLRDAARLHPELWDSLRDTLDDTSFGPAPLAGDHPLDRPARAALAVRSFEMAARNEPVATVIAAARSALPPVESATIDDPGLMTAAGTLVYAGDVAHVRTVLAAALARAGVDNEFAGEVPGLRFRLGQCLAYLGETQSACDELSFAVATEQHGWAQYVIAASANLARTLIDRGELDAAAAVLERAISSPFALESTLKAELYEARGRLRLWQRRYADALGDFREAGRRSVEVFPCRNPAMLPWRGGAAFAANQMGAVAAARQLTDDEVGDARRFGEPRALARALRLDGLIRRGDAGIERLREALDVVADSDARVEHAYVLFDLGGALRRSGRPRDARAHLRAAADLADRIGAHGLAEQISIAVRLAGGRPRRARLFGPLALTPAEQRVAEHARAGATNREIARELYVSPKAIEYHLGNAYRKLGIASRRQLADALAVDDPSPPPSR